MKNKIPTEWLYSDPFLCEACQTLGYCKNRAKQVKKVKESRNLPELKQVPTKQRVAVKSIFVERDLRFWVPIRTGVADAARTSGKKLQQAHDLFHQDEFEQASYLYRDLLETRNDYEEAWIGLAATLYFLGAYDEAATAASKLTGWEQSYQTERFMKLCETAIRREAEQQQQLREKKEGKAKVKVKQTTLALSEMW